LSTKSNATTQEKCSVHRKHTTKVQNQNATTFPLEDTEEVFDGSNEGVVQWEISPTYDTYQDPGPHDSEEEKKALPELEEADEIQHEAYDR